MSESAGKKDWFSKFFTIVVPVGLAVFSVIGIWIHVAFKDDESLRLEARVPRKVSQVEVTDIQKKIGVMLGNRGVNGEVELKNLQATRSFIAGSLSPENAGYAVNDGEGVAAKGYLYKSLWVNLRGKKNREVIRVMTRMDGGKEEAADVAVVLSLAQAMAADTPRKTIRFMFMTGLEDLPLGISRKASERYAGVLWVGKQAPEGVRAFEVDPENAFVSALQLREELERMLAL